MEAHAILRKCPVAPRKMRRFSSLIEGLTLSRALSVLRFQPSPYAMQIEKLLLSAVANWQAKYENEKIENSSLYVKSLRVDAGPIIKRFRPAPHGRATRIRKRSSQTLVLIASSQQKSMSEQKTNSSVSKQDDQSTSTPESKRKENINATS